MFKNSEKIVILLEKKQWFCFVVSNFSENDYRKTRCFQHRGVKTRGVLTTWFPDLSTLPAIFNIFYPLKYSIFFTEISHSWYQYLKKKNTEFQHGIRNKWKEKS